MQAQYLPSSDDLTQIAWQIAQAYQLVTTRAPAFYQQVIPVSGPAGRVYQAVRQLPAPSPDVIQRIYVVQPGRDLIDLVIQGAQTPSPVYQDQTVWQPSQPPTIYPRVVQPQQTSTLSVSQTPSVLPVATAAPVPPVTTAIMSPQLIVPSNLTSIVPVMPTMTSVPVSNMPMATAPMMYAGYAMPSFVANTVPFPVSYGTRTFPKTYPSRLSGVGRPFGRMPFLSNFL